MADSNIRLRDAAGREIPIGTNTVYTEDGKKLYIREVTFNWFINKCELHLVEVDGGIFHKRVLHPEQVYLKNPITQKGWEELLDDLKNVSEATNRSLGATCCIWFNDGKGCVDCPANEVNDETCGSQFVNDIAARIRKLRGED